MAGENEREDYHNLPTSHEHGHGPEEPSAPPIPSDDSPPELLDAGGTTYYVNMAVTPMMERATMEEQLVQFSLLYALKGLLFTVVGVIAILFPVLFGLTVERMLAWILVLGGGVNLVLFVLILGKQDSIAFLLLGALHVTVGVWLLVKPVEGLLALTYILTAWFLVHGSVKVGMAYRLQHISSWPAVLISGLLSIALGIAILILTPIYGLQLLGIIFGADLLTTGVAVLLISLMAYCGLGRTEASDSEAAREPLLDNRSAAASSA